MRRRKSSLSITLVLIGSAALSSCGDRPDQSTRVMRRDVYSSLEDCHADWGRTNDCEVGSRAASGTGSTGHYFGPRYYWSDSSGRYDNPAPRPGSRATGISTIGGPSHSSTSRGGFGSSSAAHGGSGHS